MENYDVLIFDNCAQPYTGSTYRWGALGGSEFEIILLAEGLAKQGYKIAVLNCFNFPTRENDVDYWPVDILNTQTMTCKTLLVMRTSPVPQGRIEFDNIRFWFTDLPSEQHLGQLSNWLAPGRYGVGICVSEWHRSLYPQNWNFTSIHNMIPDWVYDLQPKPKNSNKYMYASAAMKGLDQTLDVWRELKKSYFLKKSELYVCSPGYDSPDMKKLADAKVSFLGNLPFHILIKELQTTQHLFYVNIMPETFCIVAVLAEILGVTPQVLAMSHPGALLEVLSNNNLIFNDLGRFQSNVFDNAKKPPELKKAKDYRVSTILPKWIKELKI